MQSRNSEYPFSPNFNFGVDNLLVIKNQDIPFLPLIGDFQLLDGTHFKLLDSTNFLLL